MWAFEIVYKDCGEWDILYGYSWADACRRSGLDPNDPNLSCWTQYYED